VVVGVEGGRALAAGESAGTPAPEEDDMPPPGMAGLAGVAGMPVPFGSAGTAGVVPLAQEVASDPTPRVGVPEVLPLSGVPDASAVLLDVDALVSDEPPAPEDPVDWAPATEPAPSAKASALAARNIFIACLLQLPVYGRRCRPTLGCRCVPPITTGGVSGAVE